MPPFKRKLIVFILPVTYLIIQLLFKKDYQLYFVTNHDPGYALLTNGLQMALGNCNMGVFFPGTPLILLIAINIRILNLFSENSQIIADVLNNPELYLNILSIELVILNVSALIFMGVKILKRTSDTYLAFILQLTPFVSLNGFIFSSFVMMEPTLVFSVIIIVTYLSVFLFSSYQQPTNSEIIFFSLFTALGIANKIIFLPFIFLLFFTINGFKKKVFFISSVILMVVILLIPIFPVFSFFSDWMKKIFLHSGMYGQGEAIIINPVEFKKHLSEIFRYNLFYSFGFLMSLFVFIISLFPSICKKIELKKRRLLLGLIITTILEILLIAKHYSPHYLIAVQNLTIFSIVLSFFILKDTFFLDISFIKKPFLVKSFVFILSVILVLRILIGFHFSPGLKSIRLEAVDFINKNLKDQQKIIVESQLSPFIENSLYFGMVFSFGMKSVFSEHLKDIYPDTYIFNIERNELFDWGSLYSLEDVLMKNRITYFGFKSKDGKLPKNIADNIFKLKENGFILSFSSIYENKETYDYIYKIETDSFKLASSFIKIADIESNCENLSDDRSYIISKDSLYRFQKPKMRSKEKTHSGHYSIKLSKDLPYAMDIKLNINKNYYIKASCWQYSRDNKGVMVFSSGDFYRAGGTFTDGSKDGWKKMEFNIIIPDNYNGNEISFYLWNTGKNDCFFDDFRFRVFEMKTTNL